MKAIDTLFGGTEARLRYKDAEVEVRSEGDFVRCAVTGRPIPLAKLRYWNVDCQEPYASAEIAVQRYRELNTK